MPARAGYLIGWRIDGAPPALCGYTSTNGSWQRVTTADAVSQSQGTLMEELGDEMH
jgi:hypothetical protein